MLKIRIEWKIWPKNNLFWITMQQALLSDKACIKLNINGIKTPDISYCLLVSCHPCINNSKVKIEK